MWYSGSWIHRGYQITNHIRYGLACPKRNWYFIHMYIYIHSCVYIYNIFVYVACKSGFIKYFQKISGFIPFPKSASEIPWFQPKSLQTHPKNHGTLRCSQDPHGSPRPPESQLLEVVHRHANGPFLQSQGAQLMGLPAEWDMSCLSMVWWHVSIYLYIYIDTYISCICIHVYAKNIYIYVSMYMHRIYKSLYINITV